MSRPFATESTVNRWLAVRIDRSRRRRHASTVVVEGTRVRNSEELAVNGPLHAGMNTPLAVLGLEAPVHGEPS